LLKGSVYLQLVAKALLRLFCYSNRIHFCPDSTHSVEFVLGLLVARWTYSRC